MGDTGAFFSGGNINNMNFAFDSNAVPYVEYIDQYDNNFLTVMKWNASTSAWQLVGTKGLGQNLSSSGSELFMVSPGGTPWMVVQNQSVMNVIRYSAGAWAYPPGDQSSFNYYSGTRALAVDAQEVAWVARFSMGNDSIPVYRYTGAAWQHTGIVDSQGGAGQLALDHSARPVLLHRSATDSVVVVRYNSGTWSNITAPFYVYNGDPSFGFALDSSDIPYLAYQDHSRGDMIAVVRFSGGSWQPVGGSGALGSNGLSSLQVLRDGTCCVLCSYYQQHVYVLFPGSSVWQTDPAGWAASTAISPQGKLYRLETNPVIKIEMWR